MKLVSAALMSAITFTVSVAAAAEKYLEAESSVAADPWEVSDSIGASGEKVARVPPGITRNDNPEDLGGDGEGTIRFSLPAGEVSADSLQHFTLRYRSTDHGKDSVYTASEDGSFVKHNLPIGNEFQWLNAEISQRSAEDGSVELAVMYRESGAELDGVFVSDNPEAVPSTGETGGSEPAPPPTAPDPIVTPPDSGGSVRNYRAIGTKNIEKHSFDKPTAGWAVTEYNSVMKDAVTKYPCAFKEHTPSIAAKIKWANATNDSSIKPTKKQAIDPYWSNYKWNNKGTPGDGVVWDGLSDALNSSVIENGNGPAKLMILVALSSSASHWAVPEWMRKDSSLTWEDGRGKWHIRFDTSTVVDHASWFMEALLKKYGNNKGVHSIQIGEYYTGSKANRPNLSRSEFAAGIKTFWNRTASAAPKDSNGQRVNILQISPWVGDGLNINDLTKAGLGASQSDTDIDMPVTISQDLVDVRKKGKHVAMVGDIRYACSERRQGWDGRSNPFGHKKGYSAPATPQEIFWYHGEKGIVPMDSIFMSVNDYCNSGIQNKANFLNAISRFGRCGTEVQWGPSPAGSVEANANKDLSCTTEGDVQVVTNEDGSVYQKVCLLKVQKDGDEVLQLHDF